MTLRLARSFIGTLALPLSRSRHHSAAGQQPNAANQKLIGRRFLAVWVCWPAGAMPVIVDPANFNKLLGEEPTDPMRLLMIPCPTDGIPSGRHDSRKREERRAGAAGAFRRIGACRRASLWLRRSKTRLPRHDFSRACASSQTNARSLLASRTHPLSTDQALDILNQSASAQNWKIDYGVVNLNTFVLRAVETAEAVPEVLA
jgi:hypothetical protein